MKKLLFLFGGVELLMLALLILFYFTDKYTWAFPTLLTLIVISFILGVTVLFISRKKRS